MRMSCNGCRVLRKGCSDNCSIRPCLQWIKNPESQANATVFLAKFYGRAGLMNLINAGPEHLRPAIFRSLLYESCGRIVNPIYGSVGLLWSGSWQMCQAAVEAVLKGAPIMQIPSETAANTSPLPLKAYDIRHVSKDETAAAAGGSSELHKVDKATRTRFKRSSATSGNGQRAIAPGHVGDGSAAASPMDADNSVDEAAQFLWRRRCYPADCQRAASYESSAASHEEAAEGGRAGDSRDNAGSSVFSEETADASMVTAEKEKCFDGAVELELTLGLERPVSHSRTSSGASPATAKPRCDKLVECCDSDTRKVDLALDLSPLDGGC